MESLFRERRTLWIILLLVLLTLFVYWPLGGHSFITLDDEDYVTRNPGVLQGLTPEKVRWAFTTFHAANWHPLTWLSHMADVELFGLDAGWHHRVNLLLHLANTVLVFLVLRGMTDATWRSAFVAALFGVHPLHVESVAWVAERKDLLCALFWLLSTGAYRRCAVRGGRIRYFAVTFFFLMGLLSKPMIVTLPFVFLLLDYWPLRRIEGARPEDGPPIAVPGIPFRNLVLEKVPWLLLSLASCVVTYTAQGAGMGMNTVVLPVRLGNAVVAYGRYILKCFLPVSLSVFYPHPGLLSSGLPWWHVLLALLSLAGVSLAAWRWRGERPYLLVGWLYFLGTLLPVIGLVQVGMQAMADRYMYLPLIGLAIAFSWGMHDITRNISRQGRILGVGSAVLLVILSFTASLQVSRWKDSVSLFQHALRVTSENWVAYFNLADALLASGKADEAVRYFHEGLRYRPDDPDARLNLAKALGEQGRYAEAADQFRWILNRRPDDPFALANLGVTLERLGRDEEALACLRSAVIRKPDFVDGYTNLGGVLLKMGRRDEAIAQLRHALRLNPNDPIGNSLMQSAMEGGGEHTPQRDFRQ